MDNRQNRGRGRFSGRKKSKPFAGQASTSSAQRDVRLDGFRPFTDNVPAVDKKPQPRFFWKGRLVEKAEHEKLYIPCPNYTDIPVYSNDEVQDGTEPAVDREAMTEIVGVRFRAAGKVYYFLPVTEGGEHLHTRSGDNVIVDTARGLEYGSVFVPNKLISNEKLEQLMPMRHVVRLATEEDNKTYRENLEVEKRAESIFVEKVAAHGLPMKLIDIQYTFDRAKILFFFSSEGRVDFRELVKDLASVFHTRIELRQIGIRDEARIMGGLGACGRPLCCSSFLTDFVQVSIKMAKSQIVSLNPTKISGCCGRLMCCLRYENDTYEREIALTPPVDAIVKTPDGYGTVCEIQPLAETVKVKLVEKGDVQNPVYHRDDVEIVSAMDDGYRAAVERAQKQLAERAMRTAATVKPEAPADAGTKGKSRPEAPVAKVSSQGLFANEEDGADSQQEQQNADGRNEGKSSSKSHHKSRSKKGHSHHGQKSKHADSKGGEADTSGVKPSEQRSAEEPSVEGAQKSQASHHKRKHSHSHKSADGSSKGGQQKSQDAPQEKTAPAKSDAPKADGARSDAPKSEHHGGEGKQSHSKSRHHHRHHHKKSGKGDASGASGE